MHLLSIVASTTQSGKWEVSKPTKNYPDQTVQILVLIQKKYERLYPQKLSRKIKWLSNCEGTRQILRYIYIGGKKPTISPQKPDLIPSTYMAVHNHLHL